MISIGLVVIVIAVFVAYGSFNRNALAGRYISLDKIRKELTRNEEEGIINNEQRLKLEDSFMTIVKATKVNIVGIVAILGAIIFGLGIILFATANWKYLNNGFKITSVTLLMIIFYTTGYYFAYYKKTYPFVGKSLIFLGTLVFGGDLFLLNNLYNIFVDEHILVLTWTFGVIPLCFAFKEILYPVLYSMLIFVWNIMYMENLSSFNLAYVPLLILGLYLAYKYDSAIVLLINIFGIVLFYTVGITNLATVGDSYGVALTFALLGAILYGVSRRFDKSEFINFAYKIIFLILINLSFLLMTFKEFNNSININFDILSIMVIGLTLIGGIYLFISIKRRDAFTYLVILIPIYFLLIQFISINIDYKIIATNILFPIFILYTMYYGYRKKEGYIFVTSLIAFVVEIIARYSDYFFALLPRSAFFIIGGAILLIGAVIIERKVKSNIREGESK